MKFALVLILLVQLGALCSNQKALKDTHKCLIPGCLECPILNSCDACLDGFFKFSPDNCAPCKDNCKRCTSKNDCSVCFDSYQLQEMECIHPGMPFEYQLAIGVGALVILGLLIFGVILIIVKYQKMKLKQNQKKADADAQQNDPQEKLIETGVDIEYSDYNPESKFTYSANVRPSVQQPNNLRNSMAGLEKTERTLTMPPDIGKNLEPYADSPASKPYQLRDAIDERDEEHEPSGKSKSTPGTHHKAIERHTIT